MAKPPPIVETSFDQAQDFTAAVIPMTLLDYDMVWIRENMKPEDVFTPAQLTKWAQANIDNQSVNVGGEFVKQNESTTEQHLSAVFHSMSKASLELLADTPVTDVHDDNGPGHVECPVCKARINMLWNWGKRRDKDADIVHENHCPVAWAREKVRGK
jgi:hypothetical protein